MEPFVDEASLLERRVVRRSQCVLRQCQNAAGVSVKVPLDCMALFADDVSCWNAT